MSTKPLTAAAKKTLASLRSTFGAGEFMIDFRFQSAYTAQGDVAMPTSIYNQLESRKLIAPVLGTLRWTVTAE